MAVIIDDNGRFRSERTDNEVLLSIKNELSNLSDNEVRVLREMLKELATNESKVFINEDGNEEEFKFIDLCRDIEYERPVVDIEMWLSDPYYSGDAGKSLFPSLRKDFIELFSGGYNEAILTGAIGYGKTFFSNLAICRMIYEISCLRDPQKSFGQSKGQQIAIVNYHVTEKLAKKVVFGGISPMIQDSQYFQDHFPPHCTKEEIIFPNNVWLAPLSGGKIGSLGANVFGGIVDECLCYCSRLYLIDSLGILVQIFVGDLWNMPYKKREQYKIIGLNHDKKQVDVCDWEIKKSIIKDIVCIEFNDGELNCSYDHPILVRRGEWLVYEKAYSICEDDEIVMLGASNKGNRDEDSEACKKRKNQGEVFGVKTERILLKELPSELKLVKIKKVTIKPSEETFSISTTIKTFIVDGIVTHNSNFRSGSRSVQERASHKKHSADDAKTLYNSVIRRMKSRFGRSGKVPGILLLPSSKQTSSDFTQQRIIESRDNPSIFVRDYALWDVLPSERFSKKRFQVFVGADIQRSRILQEGEQVEITDKMREEGCSIVSVPEDYRFDFEDNIDDALRDLAGVATFTTKPFIVRREKITEGINHNYEHPVEITDWIPNTPLPLKKSLMVRMAEDGRIRPIISPRAPRFVHIDPSLTDDVTGFAMGHISGYMNVTRRDRTTGKLTSEKAPIIVIDFMLRIVPPSDDEIDLGTGRQLVYILTEMGYPIRFISMDSYQSIESKQKLIKKGYKSEIVSVDKTLDPYKVMKEALYEGRLVYYNYKPFIDELRGLVDDRSKGKVDHLDNGSKDVADAVCGVCYCLSTNNLKMPMPIMKGVVQKDDIMREYEWVVGGKKISPKDSTATGKPKRVAPPLIFMG